MRYLQQFLTILSNNERDQLTQLNLRGREKAVMDVMLALGSEQSTVEQGVLDKLHVSPSHFNKITTVLLNKCYTLFAGPNNEDILRFLFQRDLMELCYHELKKAENRLLRSKTPVDELESFYRFATEMYYRTPAESQPSEKSSGYGQKYLKYKSDYDPTDEIWLRLFRLNNQIDNAAEKSTLAQVASEIMNEISACEEALGEAEAPIARFELYQAKARMTFMVDYNNEEALQWYEKALDVCDNNEKNIWLYKNIVLMQIGSLAYFTNRYERAFEVFNMLYNDPAGPINRVYYVLLHFANTAFMLGKMDTVKDILEREFEPAFQAKLPPGAVLAAMCFGIYYMLIDEPKTAMEYILGGIDANKKNVAVLTDIELRVLHNTCFLFLDDLETAYNLARKNIHFLQTKDQRLGMGGFAKYFKLLLAAIRERTEGKLWTAEHEKQLAELLVSEEAVYALLLKAIRMRTAVSGS